MGTSAQEAIYHTRSEDCSVIFNFLLNTNCGPIEYAMKKIDDWWVFPGNKSPILVVSSFYLFSHELLPLIIVLVYSAGWLFLSAIVIRSWKSLKRSYKCEKPGSGE